MTDLARKVINFLHLINDIIRYEEGIVTVSKRPFARQLMEIKADLIKKRMPELLICLIESAVWQRTQVWP